MFERAYARAHVDFRTGDRPLDVGSLAEVCLFYRTTALVLGRATLRQLLASYGADSVVRFVRDRYVEPYYLAENVGVINREVGTVSERHRPVTFTVGQQDPSAEIVALFREATGRSGHGARRAHAFIESVTILELGNPWQEDLLAAFRDSSLVSGAVAVAATYAEQDSKTLVSVASVEELDDGYFRLAMSPQWNSFQRRFEARHGQEIAKGNLLVHLVESLTDLQLAARLNTEVTTSPLGADLLSLKCRQLARVAQQNGSRIADFQNVTLQGLDIRSVMNSGERDLDDLMALLDRARRFRQWIAAKPIESDLVAAYLQDVTAGTWASRLPAKVLRLAILLAAGTLIAGPIGLAVGASLSAGDMFLLERMVAGWRPNQFVDNDLNPFVATSR